MVATASAVKFREYERIFTGANQNFGYENPILDFISDTTLQVLPVDKITYFHYPITAPSGLLVDTDLVNSGAVAGNIPYHSDKMWKKMANYSTTSIWGDSQPVGKQTGIWLCSWLSADQNNVSATPVWIDRWYNPGYIDSSTAMFIANPLSSMVMDIPSEMIMDAGCWYKYYHVGNTANSNFVYSLTGNNNTNLKLHLDVWSQNPTDLSPYNNTSEIVKFTSDCVSTNGVNVAERPTDDCLNLNGIDQHCQTLHNSSYALTGDMTCSMWVYANDWSNIQGNQIVSKNHRGGWNLKYNNGFFNPYFVVANTTGTIAFGNSDGFIYYSKNLPTPSRPTSIAIDYNMYTWVADNSAKKIYKIDYNGDIRSQIVFDSTADIQSITVDTANLWVLDSSVNGVSSFDLQTSKLTFSNTVIYPAQLNDMTLDLNSNAVFTSGAMIVVDNNNNSWTSESGTVYKNGSPILTGDYIACDKDNNIWVLQGNNAYTKFDNDGGFILSGTVGSDATTIYRGIDFTNEYTTTQYKDYVWFTNVNEQMVYKYDLDGNYVTRINLILYNLNPALKKSTTYDWNRKFNYIRYNKIPQIQTDIFLNTSPISGFQYTLTIPTTSISNNDWHMFTFTFDQSTVKFYMDAILRDSYSTSYNKYVYYEYENPLMIGANVGKIGPLDDELSLQKTHFKGKVDDLQIYNIVLNNSDIRHIYLNKFDYHDLQWNMPTGEQSYLEEIERFFKFKLPGLKSQYYNIRLIGLGITDVDTRALIEEIIKKTVKKIAPAYAELYRIVWE